MQQKRKSIADHPDPGSAGRADYRARFLDVREADALLAELERVVAWRRELLRLYGREVTVPRQIAWCGDHGGNYRYAGSDHTAQGWLPALEPVRARLEAGLGCTFEFALLNRYASGAEYMGWHADDEPGMRGPVASLSLGAPRRFLYRRGRAAPSEGLVLEHGSLLVFDPSLRHTLPRSARAGLRVNVTFRRLRAQELPR
jgi:alkylated DNA repair dioxygenase AlkB